ncbi:Uma2 family endonuclease [Actinoplanes aureus]|nr:Uma2 family endonuclease [Actinoplanes aureus]
MTEPGLHLPPIEGLDVEDLARLPRGYRYELHGGNLVIMTPTTFWHKAMAGRLFLMFHAAGLTVFQDPGVRGDRPRDCRLPDVGVVDALPPGMLRYSNLPGTAYRLVVEIVSANSPDGEFTHKALWCAEQGIPEYWIVEETSDHSDDDAMVSIRRLTDAGGGPAYVEERSLLLSELEAEYRAERG